MPYCLACGMLRETNAGFCRQCQADMAMRKSADAKLNHVRVLKEINRNRAARSDGPQTSQQGNDDIAQEQSILR